MTNVLFKTPVGLHEIAFIKLDSESNKPEQDPYNGDIFFILLSPVIFCSLSISRWVYIRQGFRATWQPFSCDYRGTICDTAQSVLMAHFQAHRSDSHSLCDLSTCYAASPAQLFSSSPIHLRGVEYA